MNRHREKNDHVSVNNKSCPDDEATNRRNRNTNNEQPRQVDKSHNERRVNSAQAVMYASKAIRGSNPQSEKADASTKRANLITVQRQLHSTLSKTEKEKRDLKRDFLRRGDYYTHVDGPDLCDEKLKAENRLHCSGRKTDPSSTIRTQLTQKKDIILIRPKKNNNSWDSACKRKINWDDALENKKRKPSHSHDKGGHNSGSAISCASVVEGKEQKRGEEAEHPRRSVTGENSHIGSIGRMLPVGEQRRRDELSGGDPRMRPCVSGRTSEGTSLAIEERRGESSAFALTPNDKLEDVSLKGGSRREHPWGVHIKPKEDLSHGSYVDVVKDDGNSTVGAIPKGGPPISEEVDEPIECKEQKGREEKRINTGQADQREAPLNRDTSISAIEKGEGKEKCIHSREDSFSFRKRSMGEERTDEIAVYMVSRWNSQSASRDHTDRALPPGGHTEGGNKKGPTGTHLFSEIRNAYKERMSSDLQISRPMKKPPEDESSHVLQRRGELSTHNYSDDGEVEKGLRGTYKSGESVRDTLLDAERIPHANEDTDMVQQSVALHEGNAPATGAAVGEPPSKAQREEAPPPNRRFAAHTLSSNSKNIKTIKGNFKQGQKKGTPASQKGNAIPKGAATQLIKTNNKGIIQNEGERKNTIFPSSKRDKDSSGVTFTRGVSRKADGTDAPDGLVIPYCHLSARSALPKGEKDKSDKTTQMRKFYGQFGSSRGMATHGRNPPGVGSSIMRRMNGHPGGVQRGSKGKDVGRGNPNEEATNPMEGPSTLLPRTNLVVGDGERIKRHNGFGGNKGIQSHNYGHSRNELPSRGLQAKTTNVVVKRNPHGKDNSSSNSNSSVKTSRTLLSSASSSSFRGAKGLPSERGNKITTQLYKQGSRNRRGEDENITGTTKRNKDNYNNSSSSMSKRSENAIGSKSELSRRRPLVHMSKCRGNADAANMGSSYIIESRTNTEEKPSKDESPRCNLTHFSNSKKGSKKSHLNYKDPISEEMERHRMDQKKKKNVKSNSIPPGNMNKGGRSNNSKNIFLAGQHDCSGEGEDGEAKNQGGSRSSTFRKRSDSYDERGKHPKGGESTSGTGGRSNNGGGRSFAKETLSDNSRRQDSSSSASQRERKEISYFEWLAREKRKKEEGMNTGEGTAACDGASTQRRSAEGEAIPCEVGEKNPLSDALQEEHYHLMLQPLSAFNLKQNERHFEQEDFIVDKNPIGNGRTGLVFKAIIKKENEYVALKVMAKDTIASLNIERQVLKEIIIQASLSHKNILQLIAYFEDRTRLFLILELANGGSIRNKMKSDAQPLVEEQVALYVYQIADALAYLHKFNIIHRDLKPDNILLHHSDEYKGDHIYKYGVVKIADFGFSCQLKNKRQKRSTFCGTVDYMPPEIINQIPYDCNVDLWCLGIVIFELLVGFPPFTDDTQERIFSQIKELNFHFPKAISLQARDLILKLCSRTADERISAEEVKTHPWVKQFL
ncbi:Serine/threonine protein kinase [Plasmodium coatneyi]|uniref:Aurora kinase n=1 Tax=Plasmodium coatneyi TaxID=208452 RepID=A0A1B1DYW3_9APIC|nr:Serine/threonine protein kinase [Plasmodium coatneyi]ANQ07785.1 Serine/threonine protein kinase [Plasmodium coatneyi]